MTDDQHVRLRDSGEAEWLPSIVGMRVCSDDPAEDARLAEEHHARNEEVSRMLEEKGFGLRGDEPGGVQINRVLRLQQDARPKPSHGEGDHRVDVGAPPERATPQGCQSVPSWRLHDERVVRLDGSFLIAPTAGCWKAGQTWLSTTEPSRTSKAEREASSAKTH
jgi:hypothetical protein